MDDDVAIDFKAMLRKARQEAKGEAKISASAETKSEAEQHQQWDEFLKRPMQLSAVQPMNLSDYVAGSIPRIFYVPNWITQQDEENMLKFSREAPAQKWTSLSRRRLQCWGGVVRPQGTIQEPLPLWLTSVCKRLVSASVFARIPNHVLLNEYRPGDGILAHEDGPAYFPRVAIVSLGGSCVMSFYKDHAASVKGIGAETSSIFLARRSLLVFEGDVYSKMLHSISEVREDRIQPTIINGDSAGVKPGDAIPRDSTRISLTIRIVPSMISQDSMKSFAGAWRRTALHEPASSEIPVDTDKDSHVWWIQSSCGAFVDVRAPEEKSFAGVSNFDEETSHLTWIRVVDVRVPGTPDVGAIQWKSDVELDEFGVGDDDYREVWRRTAVAGHDIAFLLHGSATAGSVVGYVVQVHGYTALSLADDDSYFGMVATPTSDQSGWTILCSVLKSQASGRRLGNVGKVANLADYVKESHVELWKCLSACAWGRLCGSADKGEALRRALQHASDGDTTIKK